MDETSTTEAYSPAPVALLDEVTAALSRELPMSMAAIICDEGLFAVVAALPRLLNHLHGVSVVFSAEVDRRCAADASLARDRGCKNGTELLQRSTGASAQTTRGQVRLGQRLEEFSLVSKGLESGDLPLESATLIVNTLAGTDRSIDTTLAEADLVNTAQTSLHHADDVRSSCREWKQALTPTDLAGEEKERLRRRSLRLGHTANGMVAIHGELLPEVGAILGRIFDAVNSPRTTTDADAMFPDADQRTPDQKRHDALAMALTIAAKDRDMPTVCGAPITVVIQAREEDLDSENAAGWLESFDGTAIPTTMASVEHAACAGAVQRVLRSASGRITGLGNPGRIFNASQRRAITLRDGGCVIPGCTVPSTWCEIHHVEPHARGGPTHTDNGVMLCYFHHRSLDSSGWSVRMRQGLPEVLAPPWLDPTGEWMPTTRERVLTG